MEAVTLDLWILGSIHIDSGLIEGIIKGVIEPQWVAWIPRPLPAEQT